MGRSTFGFTLIEVIVSMVLLGIVAALAGLGLATGVKGYVFARENAELSQKGQVATERIRRELMNMRSVDSFDATSISYSSSLGGGTIGLDGSVVRLVIGDGDLSTGDILVDSVSSFTMTRTDNSITGAHGTGQTTTISITLELEHVTGSGTVSLSTTVNARNTGMLNSPLG